MKTDHSKRAGPSAPTCWQREAPSACLRVETSPRAAQIFPYQHLVTATLSCEDTTESLRLSFSSHDVQITGRNLRPLLVAIQDFAVKWLRALPERYHVLQASDDATISSIEITEPE